MTKEIREGILFVIIFASIVVMMGGQWYARGQWKEREADLTAQVDSTNEHWLPKYTADSAAWALAVEELVASNTALANDSARLHQQADSLTTAGEQSDSALAVLQAAVDTSQLPQEARDLFVAANSALLRVRLSLDTCNNRFGIANGQRTNCQKQLDGARERMLSLEQLRSRLTAERDSAMALNQPPSFFKLTFDLGLGGGCSYSSGAMHCGPSVHFTIVRVRLPISME